MTAARAFITGLALLVLVSAFFNRHPLDVVMMMAGAACQTLKQEQTGRAGE